MKAFLEKVYQFNKTTGLPTPIQPVVPTVERLQKFKKMLADEIEEIEDVIDHHDDPIKVLVSFADLLGDLAYYCFSEANRTGIPLDEVLAAIADSNATKLNEDGTATIIEGKVMKGINYQPPEPAIEKIIRRKLMPRTIQVGYSYLKKDAKHDGRVHIFHRQPGGSRPFSGIGEDGFIYRVNSAGKNELSGVDIHALDIDTAEISTRHLVDVTKGET